MAAGRSLRACCQCSVGLSLHAGRLLQQWVSAPLLTPHGKTLALPQYQIAITVDLAQVSCPVYPEQTLLVTPVAKALSSEPVISGLLQLL